MFQGASPGFGPGVLAVEALALGGDPALAATIEGGAPAAARIDVVHLAARTVGLIDVLESVPYLFVC